MIFVVLDISKNRYIRSCERGRGTAISSSNSSQRHDQRCSVDSVDAWLLGRVSNAASRFPTIRNRFLAINKGKYDLV